MGVVPYGSGAILNEIDGNLTLWKKRETGVVSLHWQGKLPRAASGAIKQKME
jgi:hypothetical protein